MNRVETLVFMSHKYYIRAGTAHNPFGLQEVTFCSNVLRMPLLDEERALLNHLFTRSQANGISNYEKGITGSFFF